MNVAKLTPSAPPPGMDRRIERRPLWRQRRWQLLAAALGVAAMALAFALPRLSQNSQTIAADELSIAEVRQGIFEDFVPVRGRVTPLVTVYLDSIEGGRVERLLAEDGASVKRGQLVAVLSNTALQFDVVRSEAEVAQQLNNLRAQEIALERNRLENKRSMIETALEQDKIERRMTRETSLAAEGWIAPSRLRDTQDDARAATQRLALLRETQATDLRLQESQLAQLRESARNLEKSLMLARSNLDALNVRAPVDGQLTAFTLEIGQSVARGERIGQIDSPGRSKLQADIDEYFLSRVQAGQSASVEIAGKAWPMRLAKIYPNVRSGNFQVDLAFTRGEPEALRRGQAIDAKLTLSDPSPARLLPYGSFYQDTGGAWVFVVTKDGERAVKRSVKLGRRNAINIEVLDGLQPGERVITSPYTGFLDKDRLDLSSN
jgi:HlyD family secretion protein